MKNLYRNLLLITGAVIVFAACKKFDTLPYYGMGTAPTLSASTTAVTASPGDSASAALVLNWTNPNYSTDSATQKFVIEIDSAGRNFMKEYTRTVSGSLSTTFTAAELNTIAAGLGFKPDSTYSLDVRIKSSYANNNEQYSSNVITVTIKPYIVPVTLTASSTSALTLSIDNAANTALSFDWTASQFGNTAIYYALQIDTAGGSFATPQMVQYGTSLSSGITVGDLNTALINLGVVAGSTANAVFRIVGYLDAGYTQPAVYSNDVTVSVTTYLPFLYQYVPGDYQGWNPGSAPSIAATVPNLNAFEGYVYVPSGGTYEFKITSAPDWSHTNYGGSTGELSTSGGNLVWPNGGGYYLLKTDMTAMTWSATNTTWGLIGDATPNGWDASTAMTYDIANNVWVINSIYLSAGAAKFRANNAWDINLGGNLSALNYGGDNIPITEAGNYKVVLDLSHPLKYTATFTRL